MVADLLSANPSLEPISSTTATVSSRAPNSPTSCGAPTWRPREPVQRIGVNAYVTVNPIGESNPSMPERMGCWRST